MELTSRRSLRLGPPCLAKRLSFARLIFSLPALEGGNGVPGQTVLRSNSRRARRVSHCRDRLSQNELGGVWCLRLSSSFCRLAVGCGGKPVLGSASISCRFRL